jgi:hypothetical protein
MARHAVVVTVLGFAACGRFGFLASDDANDADHGDGPLGIAKPDAPLSIDSSIDSPIGAGSYTITDGTAPYVALVDPTPVPGFATGVSDDESLALALPFPFTFYGIAYDSMWININGFIAFDTPPTGAEVYANDCPLDGTPPDAMIAVFWDDLYSPVTAPMGTLGYSVDGTPPDRRVSVEWVSFDGFYAAGTGGNFFGQEFRTTHKVVLHETGTIELHYGPRTPPRYLNKDCGADRHRGCSATVGLRAPSNSVIQMVQCGTATGQLPGYVPIDEGRLITFVPN